MANWHLSCLDEIRPGQFLKVSGCDEDTRPTVAVVKEVIQTVDLSIMGSQVSGEAHSGSGGELTLFRAANLNCIHGSSVPSICKWFSTLREVKAYHAACLILQLVLVIIIKGCNYYIIRVAHHIPSKR
jgi:hypothetical protein